MHLANSQFLYLFLLLPVYFVLLFLSRKKTKGISISVFSDLKKAKGDKKSLFTFFKYLEYFLLFLIFILWIFVLARPQGEHQKENLSKKGIDIIIAIDVSESMLAEDLKPNRIEAAKKSLEKFIDNLSDDRLGIVVFAGQAFTQSPLTFDYNILREYIDNISTDSINKNVRGLSGTAIGDSILSALNRFKKSEDRTKVLIVITDGDANTGANPKLAAKKAKKEGVKIYTVGVGKPGGAPIPVTDALGRKTYAQNRDGSRYMATFNENSLKEIAEAGGGKYFRVGDNESFDRVMSEINSLEKREIKVNSTIDYTENFYSYLVLLNIIFLIYLFSQYLIGEEN